VLHWPLAEALLEFEGIVTRRALRNHQLTILSWQLGHEEGAAAPQTPAVLRRDGVEE
jgi:hypothetical protein